MRLRMGVVVAGALAVITGGTAVAASQGLTRHHTPAGTSLAQAALLHRSDLGPGWSEQSPAPRRVPPLTCPRFSPRLAGVVEQGAAVSPTFGDGSSGPFESQAAFAYASPAQALTLWRKVAVAGLLRCIAASLSHGSGAGVTFQVTARRALPIQRPPGARAARYRVSGTATGSGQSTDVFLDVILVGRGQTVSAISLSSFTDPPERRLELRLSRAVARRMSAG